jgi:hypothetical protein
MLTRRKVRNGNIRNNSTYRLRGSGFARVAVCALAFTALASADQLILNGNFSAGDTSFQTDYTFVAANGSIETGPGEFSITSNPGTQFTNLYNSYTDHTGDTAALMLFIDGGPSTSNAWAETFSVAPSTTYTFTGWVASADNENLAVLGLFANNVQVGSSLTAPASPGVWTEWQQTVTTSPSENTLTLAIRDLNTNYVPAGDDFTLDDLALNGQPAYATPEPSFTFVCLAALSGLVLIRRFRRA